MSEEREKAVAKLIYEMSVKLEELEKRLGDAEIRLEELSGQYWMTLGELHMLREMYKGLDGEESAS